MATAVPNAFHTSYRAFEEYPRDRIYLPFRDGIVEEYNRQLAYAESMDYHLLQRPEGAVVHPPLAGRSPPEPSTTDVMFWETSTRQSIMSAKRVQSDLAVRQALGESLHTHGAGQATGTIASRDPSCRFIFLRGDSSRSPLLVTRSSLQRIFTYHQVMPALLGFFAVFGRREKPVDYIDCGFRSEMHIRNIHPDLHMPSLNRSGRHFQMCYILRAPALKSEREQVWSLRPLVVHHQFDFDVHKSNALWILTQGNLDIYKHIERLTGLRSAPTDRDFSTSSASLRTSLIYHVAYANWSRRGWHEYVSQLVLVVKAKTELALDDERSQAHTRHEYTSDEVRSIRITEEDLQNAATSLQQNIETLTSLRDFYHRLSQNKDFTLRITCEEDICTFLNELENIMIDLRVELQRVNHHTGNVSERKALIVQYLQVQQNEINTSLAADTQQIALASKREAIAVSIITILTLFYLPATFVSVRIWLAADAESHILSNVNEKTFLQAGIDDIEWGNMDNKPTFAKWGIITGALTGFTLTIALCIFFFRREKRKSTILPRYAFEKTG